MQDTMKLLTDDSRVTHTTAYTIRLDIEPLESDMKSYTDTYYSSGLKTITTDEHIDLLVSRLDKYLAKYNKELFILDNEDYESFFDGSDTSYKAIIIEKDNYNIPSEAGDSVSAFNTIELALMDLIIRLLLEKGN